MNRENRSRGSVFGALLPCLTIGRSILQRSSPSRPTAERKLPFLLFLLYLFVDSRLHTFLLPVCASSSACLTVGATAPWYHARYTRLRHGYMCGRLHRRRCIGTSEPLVFHAVVLSLMTISRESDETRDGHGDGKKRNWRIWYYISCLRRIFGPLRWCESSPR